ncbi:MAG: priA [Chlamydiales bacterium]|jgi:primosomal protein N' (replication factor Y)|nr:priA [Chlamydiales bacterium]
MSAQTFVAFAKVMVDVALDKVLDYGIPQELKDQVFVGSLVSVKLRHQLAQGYVLAIEPHSEWSKVSPILEVVGKKPLIPPDLIALAKWMGDYYACPLGIILKSMVPSGVRKQTQVKKQYIVRRNQTREELIALTESLRNKQSSQALVLDVMLKVKKEILLSELLEKAEVSKSPVDSLVKRGALTLELCQMDSSEVIDGEYFLTKPKTLNEEQQISLQKITASLERGLFSSELLFGVTGSGKTEVYLQAIEKALSLGKTALMLVPEISLTAQTLHRIRSRFPGQVAVHHHRLSEGERLSAFEKMLSGEAKIALGARSAIFSPLSNIGLIIVDEEHESSYKQNDEKPCYQARDVAVVRAKLLNATVVLGSATPSLESYYNVEKGKYHLSCLKERADHASIPRVRVVDMRPEYQRKGFSLFSEPLLEAIRKRQGDGQQSILFLNRRGYHTNLSCERCGEAVQCTSCDQKLAYHRRENRLTCHLCGMTLSPPPQTCPKCQEPGGLKYRGIGTEQVEATLCKILPEVRTLRIDADTTKHKGSHDKLLRDFGRGKADVLIGTQMIAKGLHFPEVTLVGVLNCDTALNIPDFRAAETAFQLMTQVAGRSGRGASKGEVIFQTSMPENATILHAVNQDYEAFFREELKSREFFGYPPFIHLIKVALSSIEEPLALFHAEKLQRELSHIPAFEALPVLPAGHARVKDTYRFQFIVKTRSVIAFNRLFKQILSAKPLPHKVKLLVDVDPSSTFF